MKYKIGLIGCGRISSKHLEGIINNKDKLTLVALADKNRTNLNERLVEFQNKLDTNSIKNKINCYSDYKELLSKEKPDIVSITTESGYHCEITLDALDQGANVLVEKPMALSIQDAKEMIQRASQKNKKLGVCFQNRFNLPVSRAYEALQSGRFGKIHHSTVQIRWNRNDSYYNQAKWRGTWDLDGGTLMNQCTHGIDLLQWFMGGKAKKIYGVLRRFLRPIEAEDFGSAIVEFENGGVGIIEGSANIYPKNLSETLSIFGENGSVVIGGVAVNRLETWRFKDCESKGECEEDIISNQKNGHIESIYGHGHTALYGDFIKALEGDRPPLISGEEGLKSLEIILAIYKSMKEGIAIDLPISFATKDMKGVDLS